MTTGAQRKSTGYFIVELSALEHGPIELNREIPLDWLEDRLIHYEFEAKPIKGRASLSMDRTGNGILIRGDVNANIETFCSTCLKDIVIDVKSSISNFLVPLEECNEDDDNMELTPDDLDREYYEGDSLSLDALVGDALMLELPMSPKCSGPCPGLPSNKIDIKGTAVDPRLAPLASIRLNKEN